MEHDFGIFSNLPHNVAFKLEGHACVSIIGLLKHIFAHQIMVEFTGQTSIGGNTEDRPNTNGYHATEEPLNYMKEPNTDKKSTKYKSFVLWSDGFVLLFGSLPLLFLIRKEVTPQSSTYTVLQLDNQVTIINQSLIIT